MNKLIEEAKRCLNCKNPLCKNKGCPIHTSVPEMIQAYLNGDLDKAGKMLFENNPLSVICGTVCDQRKQCEGSCVRGIKGEPVSIGKIERAVSMAYFDHLSLRCKEKNGKKVAIIGSGPCGIAAGLLLAQEGIQVTIYEAEKEIGGVLRYGIPEFRLDRKIVDGYNHYLKQCGVEILCNVKVGVDLSLREIKDQHDAVLVANGLWKPKKLGIPGEDFENVITSVDYLKSPESYDLYGKVIVIGAGNAAMDVSRCAVRSKAESVVNYVRTNRIKASAHEVAFAKAEGVTIEQGKAPAEFTREGVWFNCSEYDENNVKTDKPSEMRFYPADWIIVAISQETDGILTKDCDEIAVDEWGLILTDENMMTNVEGIYACGDAVTGPKTVVHAVSAAKSAAKNILNYVNSR